MDLGLELQLPDAKKQKQTNTNPQNKVLQQIAKLSMNSALQVRALRAIVMETIMVEADCKVIQAGLAASRAFAEKAKTLDVKTRENDLGLPHIHVWNAALKTIMQDIQGEPAAKDIIDRYIQQNQGTTWQKVHENVRHFKIARCFDKDKKKIEISTTSASMAESVWQVMKKRLLSQPGARELRGQAPMGDQERQIQAWLEASGASSSMKD